jgi:hypothetical protein
VPGKGNRYEDEADEGESTEDMVDGGHDEGDIE